MQNVLLGAARGRCTEATTSSTTGTDFTSSLRHLSLPLSTLAGIPPNTGKTTQLKATEERTLEKPGMLSDQILDKCSPPIHAFNEN